MSTPQPTKTPLEYLKSHTENLVAKADSACRMMSICEYSEADWDACRGAREDVKRILRQARGLIEIWPDRELELCVTANKTLIEAERTINHWYNNTHQGE